jgi:hypothetical protein
LPLASTYLPSGVTLQPCGFFGTGINDRHAVDRSELACRQSFFGEGNINGADGIPVALNHAFRRDCVLGVIHGNENVMTIFTRAGDIGIADEADLELCFERLCVEKSNEGTIFIGIGGVAGCVRFQFTIYKNVFAAWKIGGKTVSALDVRHHFDFSNFECFQIDLGDPIIGFVIDPEPVAIVATVSLA